MRRDNSKPMRVIEELRKQLEDDIRFNGNEINMKRAQERAAAMLAETKRMFRVPKFTKKIKLEKKDVRIF